MVLRVMFVEVKEPEEEVWAMTIDMGRQKVYIDEEAGLYSRDEKKPFCPEMPGDGTEECR